MRWWLYAVANTFVSLIVRALCWLLPAFAVWRVGNADSSTFQREELRLPGWLYWAGTDDNSLFGDAGHVARWRGKSRYWQMAAWLWRNPAYVFGKRVLGATITPEMPYLVMGNVNIKARDQGIAGEYQCMVGPYWNRKVIKDIGVWFGVHRCYMLETGWKLQDYAKATRSLTGRPTTEQRVAFAFSIRLPAFNPQ